MAALTIHERQELDELLKLLTSTQVATASGGAATAQGREANILKYFVPCQFNGNLPEGNLDWDYSWEGWHKDNSEDGSGALIPSKRNGAVFKQPDGKCAICRTPNNIKRLEDMEAGIIEVKGEIIEVTPLYERMVKPAKRTAKTGKKNDPELVEA